MYSPRLDVKVVRVAGRDYLCPVLPYVPPTPIEELELSWPKQPSLATAPIYHDPWDYVDHVLELTT